MSSNVRVTLQRSRGARDWHVQSIGFPALKWPKMRALEWLARHEYAAYEPSDLKVQRVGDTRYWVYEVTRPGGEQQALEGAWEEVRMAANPQKRAAKKRRPRKAKKSGGKVTRKKSTTVTVTRSNPRKRKRRRPRGSTPPVARAGTRRRRARRTPRKRRKVRSARRTPGRMLRSVRRAAARLKKRKNPRGAASSYTVAFAPSALRLFASQLSSARRAELRRAVREHPRGGVYVTLPAWHGSRPQAQRLHDRARLVLAYAAGRGRKPLRVDSIRVVAVP